MRIIGTIAIHILVFTCIGISSIKIEASEESYQQNAVYKSLQKTPPMLMEAIENATPIKDKFGLKGLKSLRKGFEERFAQNSLQTIQNFRGWLNVKIEELQYDEEETKKTSAIINPEQSIKLVNKTDKKLEIRYGIAPHIENAIPPRRLEESFASTKQLAEATATSGFKTIAAGSSLSIPWDHAILGDTSYISVTPEGKVFGKGGLIDSPKQEQIYPGSIIELGENAKIIKITSPTKAKGPLITIIENYEPKDETGVNGTKKLFADINLLKKNKLPADTIKEYIDTCISILPKETLSIEAKVIPTNSHVYVIGDIHCSFDEMLAQIELMRSLNCFIDPASLKLRDNIYLVFTGDFADRGTTGTEVFILAMGLKNLNSTNIFICRGNHETTEVIQTYGFAGVTMVQQLIPIPELTLRFKGKEKYLENQFIDFFSHLPVAVFLGAVNPKNQIVNFGMYNHAGIDESLAFIGQVNNLLKIATEQQNNTVAYAPSKLPSVLNGLVWGDYLGGYALKGRPSKRIQGIGGVSPVFDYTLPAVQNFFAKLKGTNYAITFQARAHQHKDGGIFILDPDDTTETQPGFRQITDGVPVHINPKQPQVFMFMNTAATGWGNFTYFGLGEFSIDTQGWVLTPHIMNEQQKNQYAQQIKRDFTIQ